MHAVKKSERGFTMIEVLATLALMGVLLMLVVGFNLLGTRSQKSLLAAGREFSMDLRTAVSTARSRSCELTVEFVANGYRIYVETNGTDGYQNDEELILARTFEGEIALAGSDTPKIPAEWGDPDDAFDVVGVSEGDTFTLNGTGIENEGVLVLHLEKAPVYQYVCVHWYGSGDSEVLRENDEDIWIDAPAS